MNIAEPIISFEEIEKIFPGAKQPAVKRMTAKIRADMITGLVGPDGAGKTTLMRLIAGLLEPSSGQLRIAPSGENDRGQKEWIGYMPQKFGLYEDLSVAENLELHAALRGVVGAERDTQFQRLLEFTDLARFTTRLAGRLSGGMKQKLGLACALLGHPRLLLLDEPSVGVDPVSRRELWEMVHDLVRQGLTVLWSTAYLDEAEKCGEVLLLNEGRLLFAGEPRSMTERLRGRCFRTRPLAEKKRATLARVLPDPAILDGTIQGHSVRLVLRENSGPSDIARLESEAHSALSLVPPRFEDAFIDALGGGPGGVSSLAEEIEPRPAHHETVVQAVELTRKFGSFVAADRITFSVKRGEIFGLLGPNGAGKSTTFRMMCGLLQPTSGTAHVMGIDLRHSAARARQELGYMAQKFSLYGNLTVRQNLDFFSGAYGLTGKGQTEAVEGMLRLFNLEPFANSNADTLPLGFKQRLALSCAVIHSPEIVFLDEPTSGVDPVTRREFWNHINGIVEKGVTAMVTTHFMEEAEYCDRIALVFRGRIIATGTPDALKQQAASETSPEPSMEDAFIQLVQKAAAAGET